MLMNHDIQVKPMSACETDVRREAAAVFVDGYDKELSFLSGDRDKLAVAFAKMIHPEVFYVAELEGEIVGILACSDRRSRAFTIDRHLLREAFGFLKGSIAYSFMKDEFNKQVPYPEDTGYIECVATAAKARKKGVSTALFRFMIAHAPHERFVLDVADTNVIARRLYTKLGFSEVKRVPEPFGRIKGFRERIYMAWKRETATSRA